MSEFMLQSLERIEQNQKDHNAANNLKLDAINKTLAELAVKEKVGQEVDKDHEQRIRRNETILVKVTVFFTGASVVFGSVVAWSVDKLLSVAN